MIITGIPQRAVDAGDFADLTPVLVVDIRWVSSGLEVEFASDLASSVASAVQQRIESRNANEETLRNQALVALQTNRDFLALAAPTQAQTLAQVKALSRQVNGVLRMLLGQLDGTN